MKVIIAFFLILNLVSCGDDGPECPGDMNVPVEISPYKFYYNIGDTITVTSKFYKLIYDQKTDKYYDASNYKFSPLISIYTLDNDSTNKLGSQVLTYCNFIKISNSNLIISKNSQESLISGEYAFNSDSLQFAFKLVFIRPGFYWIWTESLSSGDGHLQNNYQFNCRGREIYFKLFIPVDNNMQLMQKFRNLDPNKRILSDSVNYFYRKGGYCFEVR